MDDFDGASHVDESALPTFMSDEQREQSIHESFFPTTQGSVEDYRDQWEMWDPVLVPDYICLDDDFPDNIIPQITSVMSSCRMDGLLKAKSVLNLKDLSCQIKRCLKDLPGKINHCEYDPRNNASCLILRMRPSPDAPPGLEEKGPVCSVFKDGKLQVVGCKSEYDSFVALSKFARKIHRVTGSHKNITLKDMTVLTVSATSDLGFGLESLEKISNEYGEQGAEFDPEITGCYIKVGLKHEASCIAVKKKEAEEEAKFMATKRRMALLYHPPNKQQKLQPLPQQRLQKLPQPEPPALPLPKPKGAMTVFKSGKVVFHSVANRRMIYDVFNRWHPRFKKFIEVPVEPPSAPLVAIDTQCVPHSLPDILNSLPDIQISLSTPIDILIDILRTREKLIAERKQVLLQRMANKKKFKK
jgi:TATA-box binding protein (TBP) (component of TFIID and TFIIIB)